MRDEEVHPCLTAVVGELNSGQHTAVAHHDEDEEEGHEHQLGHLSTQTTLLHKVKMLVEDDEDEEEGREHQLGHLSTQTTLLHKVKMLV